ncbi:MAG: CHASE2 domain-containing protein [Symploca sp. SIO2G7]|nr:CHASE2 domain-containing protein [Symploca sp. SIO2G7]
MWLKLKNFLRQWQGVFLIAPSVTAIVLALNTTGLFQLLEWAALDQYFRLRHREPPDSRLLLVTIDEADTRQVGQWPVPDAVLTELITKLKAAQPRAIGLNLYRDLPVEPGYQQWVEVMKSTPNLIGIEKQVGNPIAPPPTLKKLKQVSLADLIVDSDGKIRRSLISIKTDNEGVQLSLGVRLALMYLEKEGINLEVADAQKQHYRLGKAYFVPFSSNDGGYIRADAKGYQILLNFRGEEQNFETVSMRDVLANRVPSEKIRDRILLIGSTAESTNSLFYTPYDSRLFTNPRRMPGVVIQANLTSQILSGALDGRSFIKVLPTPIEWLEVLCCSFIGAAGSWLLLENKQLRNKGLPPLLILSSGTLLAGSLTLTGTYLIFLRGWWLPIVPSLLTLIISTITITDYYYRKSQREAEQKYRSIFENALEGIFQTTPDGHYLNANPALAKIYGYDSPEALIANITNIEKQLYCDPNRRQEFVQIMEQKGQLEVFEAQVYRQDRSIIWISEQARSVYDSQGQLLYYQGFVEDITERKQAETEREKFTNELFELNQAFSRFVPSQFLHLLKKDNIADVQLGDQVQQEMSVLFADIRNFTTLSEGMSPEENFRFINSYLSHMEPAIIANQGFIDKYIGDAIMALFNGEADDAVKGAISMLKRLRSYNSYRQRVGYLPIEIGIGINTGLMMLGTVGGNTHMDSTVISDAVNLASRVEGLTKDYGVSLLISHHTFTGLVQPGKYPLRFIDKLKVKGKSEAVSVFEVFEADPPEIKAGKLKTKALFEEAVLNYHLKRFRSATTLFQGCLELAPQDKTAQIYLQRSQRLSQQ